MTLFIMLFLHTFHIDCQTLTNKNCDLILEFLFSFNKNIKTLQSIK